MGEVVKVCARTPWVDTGVAVQQGQVLTLRASGSWTDWFISCGPEGYERSYLKPVSCLRRVRDAPWFCLIGAIDKDLATAFRIGVGVTLPAPRAGRLFAFANDAPFAYGNNRGCIDLTID